MKQETMMDQANTSQKTTTNHQTKAKSSAAQAKSIHQSSAQPIQSKQGQKPPIQAKGANGQPLQPIQSKQGQKPPIQAKDSQGQPLQPVQKTSPGTGNLPTQLQANMEAMSGTDLSDVKVHYNSDKPVQLNAHAYAQGSDIHMASGQEKHLPHEAWHVVQQKQGRVQATTQLKSADQQVSINDSPALEKEADVMGEKALKGDIEKVGTASSGSSTKQPTQLKGIVQRAAKNSHYGTFTDTTYKFVNGDSALNMVLEFTPNANADATKVGLTQTVKSVKGGNTTAIDPNAGTKMTPDGHRIDQLSEHRNPLYATGDAPMFGKKKLTSYKTSDGWGQHGKKNKSKNTWTNAILKDAPTVTGGNNSSKEFETAAIALDGNQKGTYYGSVKWGWTQDNTGNVSKINFDILSMGTPTQKFLKAAKAWNDGKSRGTLVAKADNTSLYDGTMKELGKMKADDKFIQESTASVGNVPYLYGKVGSGTLKKQKGYIKAGDLKDSGNGKDTVNLPMVDVKVTNEADVPLYDDAKKSNKLHDLALNTRLKTLGEEKGLHKVQIVDGTHTSQVGYLEKGKVSDE